MRRKIFRQNGIFGTGSFDGVTSGSSVIPEAASPSVPFTWLVTFVCNSGELLGEVPNAASGPVIAGNAFGERTKFRLS